MVARSDRVARARNAGRVLTSVLDWIAELGLLTVAVITGAVQVAETLPVVGLAVPGDVAVLLAGTRVDGVGAYLLLVAVSVLGQLTGESLGFAVGGRYGPALRDGPVGRWTGVRRWARAERLLAQRGHAALVAAHFVPVAHAAAPLVAGTLRMSYRRFLAASAAGSLTWSLCYVGLGVAGGSAYREYGSAATAVALVAVAAVVAAWVALGRLRRAGRAPVADPAGPRPLRVLVVAESFLPMVNGVAGSVCRVVEHVTAAGHDAVIVAPGPGPDSYAGVSVHRVRSVGLPGYRSFRVGLAAPRTMRRLLAAHRPDVVHVASPAVLGAVGLRAARQLGIPTVAVFQTDLAGFARGYGLRGLDRVASWWVRHLHSAAEMTLVPSRPVHAALAAQGVPRLRLWRRGVDADAFAPAHRSAELRARLAPGGEVLVGTVGRLAAEKRLDLLAALDGLPGIRLVLVGDGPHRARLQRLLPGAVFLGEQRGRALSTTVASLDVFVHAGVHETFCQAVQEALAAGVPAVVPAAGGPLDLVRHQRNGLHYEPGSAAGLRHAVQRLVDSPELRAELSARARPFVEAATWEAIGDQLLGHYATATGLQWKAHLREVGLTGRSQRIEVRARVPAVEPCSGHIVAGGQPAEPLGLPCHALDRVPRRRAVLGRQTARDPAADQRTDGDVSRSGQALDLGEGLRR